MIKLDAQRVVMASSLTAPIALIEMSQHIAGLPDWHGDALVTWKIIMAIATTLVVFIPGWPLLANGVASYRRRKLNMFSLIAPGVLITYFFSLLGFLTPEIFPYSFRVHGHVPVYFEAAAMITTLVLLGQWLETRAEQHTGDALHALAGLAPAQASVLREGGEVRIAVDKICVGDLIQLRAGDRVPADGVVTRGEAAIDESMMTGETMPVLKSETSNIIAGTMVREGSVIMRAINIGSETTLARIIELVKQSQQSKAPIQRIADRVTGKLVPFVMIIALLTFALWWKFGPAPSGWYGLLHAVTVLMITCPCALGLATPLSMMSGLGRGAQAGILVRHAASLERLSSVDTLFLDKTGTLTRGQPIVHACLSTPDTTGDRVLQIAASLEQHSHHPIALAIVDAAKKRGLDQLHVDQFTSEAGGGVAGFIDDRPMRVGREDWLARFGDDGFNALRLQANEYAAQGATVVWLSIASHVTGALVLFDEIKPEARNAIAALRARGLRLIMITGDNETAAQYVAGQLGIHEVHARIKPGEKTEHVLRMKRSRSIVAMAGDGINDAPALAAADVGIALGTGTDVIMASGDIHLLRGHVYGLVQAIDLSRAVMKNIRQNLFFAFAYNAIMIPVAAGVLFPRTGMMLTPMLASAAMSLSSLTVITNALRLRTLKLSMEE